MSEKKGTFHVFLSCDDDILIKNEKIELFLNKLVPSDRAIKCIKKHTKIKLSKKDLDELKESSIYIVDTHKGLDNITSWELGYAMGKGLEVIGYYDGTTDIKIPSDVRDIIGVDETDDLKIFVENINRALADLTPKEYVFNDDWDKQYKPSKQQAGATL